MKYFCFFIEHKSEVQQVGGDMIQSPGWGGVLYRIGQQIYMQAPTYYCPLNPQNTFSPGNLKNYLLCKSFIVDTNRSLTVVGPDDTMSTVNFKVHNELDYMTLDVVQFQQSTDTNPPLLAASTTNTEYNPLTLRRRSPRFHQQSIPSKAKDLR
jgi:hypothetical protein